MNQELIEKIRAEEEATKQQVLQEEYERRYNLANIPKRLRNVTLKAVPDNASHKDKILKWMGHVSDTYNTEETTFGLYLYGGYGTGKTSLAAGLSMWALRNNLPTYFIRYADLFDIKVNDPMWHPEIETGLWEFLHKVPLLVVDDIFRNADEKYGKLNLQSLEQLLERRMDLGKLHIFTSNLNPNLLEGKDLARLGTLIFQSCYLLEVNTVPYREAISAKRKEL